MPAEGFVQGRCGVRPKGNGWNVYDQDGDFLFGCSTRHAAVSAADAWAADQRGRRRAEERAAIQAAIARGELG